MHRQKSMTLNLFEIQWTFWKLSSFRALQVYFFFYSNYVGTALGQKWKNYFSYIETDFFIKLKTFEENLFGNWILTTYDWVSLTSKNLIFRFTHSFISDVPRNSKEYHIHIEFRWKIIKGFSKLKEKAKEYSNKNSKYSPLVFTPNKIVL